MESCVRKIHFCYGHRVMNHESKCANLHGHNGVVWIHATPIQGLDAVGRVIDFSVLKEKIGSWIDTHWDHTMIIYKDDLKTIELLQQVEKNKDMYILDTNPTAENLAAHLLWKICPEVLKGLNIVVHKVVFWETENCYCVQELDPTDENVLKMYQ